jgi:hypothetical protein
MMKSSVDEPRPGGDPRFDHRHHPAGLHTAAGLDEEAVDLWQVMEHIRHHDRSQRPALEWQHVRVKNQGNSWTGNRLRPDEAADVLIEETRAPISSTRAPPAGTARASLLYDSS